MTYLINSLYDLILSAIGMWWFGSQPTNPQPDIATIYAPIVEIVDDDDDDIPMPPSPGHDRPKCVDCGGPNFSLSDDQCLLCRSLF